MNKRLKNPVMAQEMTHSEREHLKQNIDTLGHRTDVSKLQEVWPLKEPRILPTGGLEAPTQFLDYGYRLEFIPATMVYRRVSDGTIWSRPLSEWHAKFSPI